MAVLAGGLAALGAAALIAPLVLWAVVIVGAVAATQVALGVEPRVLDVLRGAVPFLVGVTVISLVAGVVTGALARHDRASRGGSAALLGLALVGLLALGIGYGSLAGLAGVYVMTLLVGVPVAALFGRVGALLVPERFVEVRTREVVRTVPEPRPAFRILPAAGRKGGESAEDERLDERERERIERRRDEERDLRQ
jgi:hypothetical protein